jgi:hypothetical protein
MLAKYDAIGAAPDQDPFSAMAREDIGQPRLRIDVVEPGRHDERDHDRGTLGATV